MQIFLSVGRVSTKEQQDVLNRLEEKLRKCGLEPKTIGRNSFTSGQPLEQIKKTMHQCCGLIVLAFERTSVQGGHEARGLNKPPQKFTHRRYATPWHQIELAMASMLTLPILVLAEEGLHEEGLLEDKYGWYVYRMPLVSHTLDTDEFGGILADWTSRCQKYKLPAAEVAIDTLTVGRIVSALKISHLWAILSAVFALVTGAFWAGKSWDKVEKSIAPLPITQAARSNEPIDLNILKEAATCTRWADPSVEIQARFRSIEKAGYAKIIQKTEGGVVTFSLKFGSDGINFLRVNGVNESLISRAISCE